MSRGGELVKSDSPLTRLPRLELCLLEAQASKAKVVVYFLALITQGLGRSRGVCYATRENYKTSTIIMFTALLYSEDAS